MSAVLFFVEQGHRWLSFENDRLYYLHDTLPFDAFCMALQVFWKNKENNKKSLYLFVKVVYYI